MSIPEAIATTTAREVVKSVMYRAARSALDDLLLSEQVSQDDALELTNEVAKALLAINPECGDVEVLKSIAYGAMTSDLSLMTGGAALTAESLDEHAGMSDYGKRRAAKALFDDTMDGMSPVSKALGYKPPEDMTEFRTDIADCFMQEFGVGANDALDCAEYFFALFAQSSGE